MGQLSKAEVESVKAFLTRTEERFRPAYGRNEIVYPRQCVFAGTTNRSEYLKDETGNRRFWPVTATKVDTSGLSAVRDQLWAEARHRFDAGAMWHLAASVAATAGVEQAARYAADVWDEPISNYLVGRRSVEVGEILQHLGVETGKQDRVGQIRVTTILTNLGWSRGPRRSMHVRGCGMTDMTDMTHFP